MNIAPPAFTGQIGVVGRRSKAHGLGCPGKHVAHIIGQLLQSVSIQSYRVVHHKVVRWLRRALQAGVRLYKRQIMNAKKLRVYLARRNRNGKQTSHPCPPQFQVMDFFSMGRRRLPLWGKTWCGVVSPKALFNNNVISQSSPAYTYDNGQLGLVTLLGLVKCLKRSLEFGKLLLHHQPILAL